MINDIIQLLGVASPQLSPSWSGLMADITSTDDFTLSYAGTDGFLAPANGYLNIDNGLEKIVLPNGTTPATGVVIKLDPQVYLRLVRLYAVEIEDRQTNTHLTERPVPMYFVYTGVQKNAWPGDASKSGAEEGLVLAGNSLHIGGKLTIHDEHGWPIDPVAVACAFNLFIQKYATMEHKALNSASAQAPTVPAANSQLTKIEALGAQATTMQLVTPFGQAFTGGKAAFSNVSEQNAAAGLYKITDVTKAITSNQAGVAGFQIGSAGSGTLAGSYKIKPVKGNLPVALRRDFLRAYVVSLSEHLTGSASNSDPSAKYDPVVVRDNEQLSLLATGNECLGYIGAIVAGAPGVALVVSQVIDSDFALPPAPNGQDNERWPNYPVKAGPPVPALPIPAGLKDSFAVSAHFIQEDATHDADVALSIICPGFVQGDSVRVYTREFHTEDGTETRGNGGAGIVANQKVVIRLRDPFGLVSGVGKKSSAPAVALLMMDVVVVNRGLFKRTFGNVRCAVGAIAALSGDETALANMPPPQAQPNVLNTAAFKRGISPAGISGTSTTPVPGAGGNLGGQLLQIIGEDQPRNAPRLVTMARNDSMVASLKGAAWSAFCGGTILKKDALCNLPFLGNPGSAGGKEISSAGVYTSGGLLAYDIARAAARRAGNIGARIVDLITGTDNWAPPAVGAAGSWAAAALQTLAKGCETPELSLEFTTMNTVPDTLPLFKNYLQTRLGLSPLPAWLPKAARTKLQDAINDAANDPRNGRGYTEFQREVSMMLSGRRDAYWALKNALQNARECIYIQGTFFGNTGYGAPGDGDDFITLLQSALATNPRLKIILCLSRNIQLGKGYEAFEAREYKKRLDTVTALLNSAATGANQVLAFHPNGFPMRPKALQHQIVIVDDVWALLGSSTFRRRGMQFDGSEDVVMMDKTIINGKSLGIKNFRVRLMKDHLNLQPGGAIAPGLSVRLSGLHESFYAIKELLDTGGGGLIAPLWEGNRTNFTGQIPTDGAADPGVDTLTYENVATALLTAAY